MMASGNIGLAFPDSSYLDWVLDRAARSFGKDRVTKSALAFIQSAAVYYSGAAVRQCGSTLKKEEVYRAAATTMRDVAAPGLLQFLTETKNYDTPRGLTIEMMGKTKMTDEGIGFYNLTSRATYRKYEEQRRVCKLYSLSWERVKPPGGNIPSGQQQGDVLQALLEDMWATEQEAKPKKRIEVIPIGGAGGSAAASPATPPQPMGGGGVAGAAPQENGEGTGEPRTQGQFTEGAAGGRDCEHAPMPENWMPTFFLTWILWGPLSDETDGDFSLESSSGPSGCDDGESEAGSGNDRKPSPLHSPNAIKLLAPLGSGVSRAQLKAFQRKEKERVKREASGSGSMEEMIEKNAAQTTEVVGILKQLAGDIAITRVVEQDKGQLRLRQEALRNLKEELEIAKEEGDEEEVRSINAKRRKLLRTSPVTIRASEMNIGGGSANGGSAAGVGGGGVGSNGVGVGCGTNTGGSGGSAISGNDGGIGVGRGGVGGNDEGVGSDTDISGEGGGGGSSEGGCAGITGSIRGGYGEGQGGSAGIGGMGENGSGAGIVGGSGDSYGGGNGVINADDDQKMQDIIFEQSGVSCFSPDFCDEGGASGHVAI